MSGRFAQVEKRIATVHKLDAVISAMRGIAASRVQEAHRHVESIRAYATTIGAAIGEALAELPPRGEESDGQAGPSRHVVVAFAAEQGFAGPFTDRVFDTLEGIWSEACELMLIGGRGLAIAAERGRPVGWSAPMVAHPSEAPALASRLTDAMFLRIADAAVARVTLVHAVPDDAGEVGVSVRTLVPFDYDRFPVARCRVAPLINLPAEQLLARLVEEYVFAEVSEAIMLSFAAENEARVRAMVAAKDDVSDTLESMVAQARRLRQEDITEEIVELATGSLVRP